MMYDFTTILNRKGKDCLAADIIPFDDVSIEEGFSRIPMWIADMSFPVAPCVQNAIYKRMEMPNYGYFQPSEDYYNSIIFWHKIRKGVSDLTKDNIGYENGVLGGVASALCSLTSPGDNILLHSPTYIGFTHTLEDTGRVAVHSPLFRDNQGIWRMDFDDMDRKIKDNCIHTVIFCSPHNPSGRVWEKWEIEKAMEVYRDNDCIVISDEIWSDIIMPGFIHIPTQTVSDDAKMRTIAFYSPSKTFSLAGLIGSYHVIYNNYLKYRIEKQGVLSHYNDMNILSMHGLIGAYSEDGNKWTSEMIDVISYNLNYAVSFIRENFKGVEVMQPQGTYMLYLDCGEWCYENDVDIHELQKRAIKKGVIWQNGEAFLWDNTIRMNFALPFELAKEALIRLKKYVFI